MKRSFSDEQIMVMIKGGEDQKMIRRIVFPTNQSGLSPKVVCRKHGISAANFYKYESKYVARQLSHAKE